MYITRTIERHLLAAAAHFPVLWLTGPRQVGKTTLLKHIKEPARTFVTLDDPLVLQCRLGINSRLITQVHSSGLRQPEQPA